MQAGLDEVFKALTAASNVFKRLLNKSLDAGQRESLLEEWTTHYKLWNDYTTISPPRPDYPALLARLVAETLIWTTRMLDWTQKIN